MSHLPRIVHQRSSRGGSRALGELCRLNALVAVVVCTCVAGVTHAQEGGEYTRTTAAMSQPVFESLQEAQELIEAKKYRKGLARLQTLREKSKLSDYEIAQIWNLTAYTYYLQEDYERAIGAYINVIKQPELPDALMQSTLKTLSQLYFTIEDYKKALGVVKQLIALVPDPSPDIYMLLGQVHFQLNEYKQALVPTKTAIDKYRALGEQPKENWLLLLRVMYYELEDYKNMIAVLTQLIELYPKRQYLLTLAGVHSELGDTRKQLAILEALYEQGALSQSQHSINLANLYLLHGVPYKAAKLLQHEIKAGRVDAAERTLRLESQAWYQARENEKTIPPLARAAAMSAEGELYVRLAQAYINLDRWQEAAGAVNEGLAKGGVKRTDAANIMLGMALFNQRMLTDARRAFKAAAGDKRSAQTARQWIAYVDSELERGKTLNQQLPEEREQDKMLQNL